MSILKQKNNKIIDLRKPVEIKTYLAVSVLGKSLNLNINYKKINVPELDMGEKDVNIYLPMRYKEVGRILTLSLHLTLIFSCIIYYSNYISHYCNYYRCNYSYSKYYKNYSCQHFRKAFKYSY